LIIYYVYQKINILIYLAV